MVLFSSPGWAADQILHAGTGRSETAVKPVIDESSAGTADGWDETEAAPVSAPSPSRYDYTESVHWHNLLSNPQLQL